MKTVSVKWRGREVHNPALRKLLVIGIFIIVPITLVVGMAFLVFIGLPLMLLMHIPLRILGRNGTIRSTEWCLDREAFRKAF